MRAKTFTFTLIFKSQIEVRLKWDLRYSFLNKARSFSQGSRHRVFIAYTAQAFAPYLRLGSIALQASTKPLTAFTELSNMICSLLSNCMSAIRSIPPLPIMVGTPTYIPSSPNSPLQYAAQGSSRF